MQKLYLIILSLLLSSYSFSATLSGKIGEFEINPNTLEVIFIRDGKKITVSEKQNSISAKKIKESKDSLSFKRDKVTIEFKLSKNYLNFNAKNGNITFPIISSGVKEFILPINNGKRIPSNDEKWMSYLNDSLNGAEVANIFSLNSFGFLNSKNSYTSYIYDNRWNSKISFKNKKLAISTEFDELSPKKEMNFRIYPNSKSISSMAKNYRNYIIQNKKFKSLKDKIAKNSEIVKLLGAPHIYLAGEVFFSIDDIKNKRGFVKKVMKDSKKPNSLVGRLLSQKNGYSKELKTALKELEKEEWISEYHKKALSLNLNHLMWNEVFKGSDYPLENAKKMRKEIEDSFGNFLTPSSNWGEGASNTVLTALKSLNINKANLILHNYEMGEVNPSFIEKANSEGYLIGAYDSYKSIHPKGKIQWNTASFRDSSLFEKGTIIKKDGSKVEGFQGTGRELNPKYSFEELNYRLDRFSKLPFNSWFFDTDAVGEIRGDYSKAHPMSKEKQISYRLKRMKTAMDKGLVVGSENGDDFASNLISYAHGNFTGIIPWWRYKQMKDKKSPYYMGRYYSPLGGVPEYFKKEMKIPAEANYFFYNEAFNVPLYQLVYNDSIIMTHHWIFDTLKVKERQKEIMLREILYNTPPMYHLDRRTLKEKGDIIASHVNFFSPIHERLALKELVSFNYISKDKLVQKTLFSDKTEIIANFSNKTMRVSNDIIPPKSLIIRENGKTLHYTPKVK